METNRIELQWKKIYRIGAICVFSATLAMITEMLLTAHPDGATEPSNITELFKLYERNWFMAMRYMGLINIIATTLLIPVFFSLYGMHRERYGVYAGLILILYIAGYAIFMADNSSFALLELTRKYELASSETLRSSLLSAGEALFAKGASHTPGTFPGFFLGGLTSILFCVIMLHGKVFKRIISLAGLTGFSIMLVFEICSSFIPPLSGMAMIIAMLGGILIIAWFIMVGIKLRQDSVYGKST